MKKFYPKLVCAAVIICSLNLLPADIFSDNGIARGQQMSVALSHYTQENPAAVSPMLWWRKNYKAVYYEIEFFDNIPIELDRTSLSPHHIYYTDKVFINAFNPDFREFASGMIDTDKPVYWRVRPMSIDHKPVGIFSDLEPMFISSKVRSANSPEPTTEYNIGNGTTLLYPVYSWVPNYGAQKFEIEILSDSPENPLGTEPSKYRIDVLHTDICEIYDETPRYGDKDFYWRVRGLDDDDQPVGGYSDAVAFHTSPADNWQVGVFGDSISHGGGHISYGPEDWEFSYLSYFSFNAINLSCSGDTSASMVQRFAKDVLPFHPHYLIVMGGTNSLRGGESAESVISDFIKIKQMCLMNGIKPIFLTLPPINPGNIMRAFNEETAPGWQNEFAKVNKYIMENFVHIDIVPLFKTGDGLLATEMGLDGLHFDENGKELIGKHINSVWPYILPEADKQR